MNTINLIALLTPSLLEGEEIIYEDSKLVKLI